MVAHLTRCNCVSNVMGNTNDDMLQNNTDEDGNISSECEEGDGADCKDGK